MTASNPSIPSESVRIFLATSLPAYKPGETVTALLTASTSQPQNIEFQDMEISFTGIERVDTSWVSPSYRKNIPALNTDKRRIQRHVISARLEAATQGDFADSTNSRRFLIRFNLPQWLPPTYKGTAVRYWYYLEAKLRYIDQSSSIPTNSDQQKTSSEPVSYSAVTRLPLLLWPSLKESHNNSNITTTLTTNTTNTNTNTNDDDVFPSPLPEELSMKCWEVGAGTTLEDAVGHISKLTSSMHALPAMPFSPGRHHAMDTPPPPPLFTTTTTNTTNTTTTTKNAINNNNNTIGNDNDMNRDDRSTSDDGGSTSTTSISTTQHASTDALLSQSSSSFAKQLTLESEKSFTSTPRQQHTTSNNTGGGGGGGGLKTFALRIGNIPLVKVSLHPTVSHTGGLYPGSIISTTLEFPTTTTTTLQSQSQSSLLQCMQMTVTLETEEIVDPGWRPRGSTQSFTSNRSHGSHGGVLRKIHDEYIELTGDVSCTNIVMSLPHDATPTFCSGLVSLKWVLKFVFVAVNGSGSETLVWTLPLSVSSL